ncbi:MAG: Holliday junction resolvase RuvX [Acutalibacteraceae bacterium]|nr:Holliday junction resolvase RuvX [Acutalibacteraceae bacterium]
MIIMSVDYGDVRTGIAVCDRLETFAFPVEVINETYMPKVINRITSLIAEKKPELIVVGYPKNMDATEGSRAAKCKEFACELETVSGINCVLWDERLTTVSAHNYLNETNTRGKKRKNVVDAVAATIILQSYIDYRRNLNV